jgi:rhodanese-related sulfurtransferase
MKKSNKAFGVLIGVMIVIFIAMIFFVMKGTRDIIPFAMNPSDVLNEAINKDNKISPIKVAKLILNKEENIVLVDIRSQYEFIKGHLPNAVNIYKADILDEDNYEFFKNIKTENKNAILYGDNVVEANIPFMILKQTGIENITLMNYGYDFFNEGEMKDLAEMGDLDLDDEIAVMDFAELINIEKLISDNITKLEEEKKKLAVKIPTKAKKKVIVKKKVAAQPVEEEEEDEGC